MVAKASGQLAGRLVPDNIQRFYDRPEPEADEPSHDAMLGSKPPARALEVEDFAPRHRCPRRPVIVLNDEAHHTHDEESEWKQGHSPSARRRPRRACSPQLDFTARRATPRGSCHLDGLRLPAQASILDGIVKRPLKGIAKGHHRAEIGKSPAPAIKPTLAAGVERWKELRDQLTPLGRKPVLFVMMNDTARPTTWAIGCRRSTPASSPGNRLPHHPHQPGR